MRNDESKQLLSKRSLINYFNYKNIKNNTETLYVLTTCNIGFCTFLHVDRRQLNLIKKFNKKTFKLHKKLVSALF